MQIFKCFGCGAGGNAIDFVMRCDDMTFWEACKALAERYGIPLPARTADNDPKTKTRAGIYEAHEIAQRLYRAALNSQIGAAGARIPAAARRHAGDRRRVRSRAFGSQRPGPHPQTPAGRLHARAAAANRPRRPARRRRRFYDRFRGRLMFPIQNEQAKIIGYGGRALERRRSAQVPELARNRPLPQEPRPLQSPSRPQTRARVQPRHSRGRLHGRHRSRRRRRGRNGGLLRHLARRHAGAHRSTVIPTTSSSISTRTPLA